MESKFKVYKKGNCGILILGLELENGEYSKDTNVARNYPYNLSVTINVIHSVDTNGNYTLEDYAVIPHTDSDISNFEFPKDGIYSISHIILPTDEYVWSDPIYSNFYYNLYYYDTLTETIKVGDDIITIEELLLVNPNAVVDDLPNSIIRGDENTFCMCYLNKCFYELSKNLLSSYCGKCLNKLNAPQQEILNRDLIWMSMNVILYLIEDNKLVEAQRILESLTGCGNICKNSNSKNSSDCGCN